MTAARYSAEELTQHEDVQTVLEAQRTDRHDNQRPEGVGQVQIGEGEKTDRLGYAAAQELEDTENIEITELLEQSETQR